MARPKRTLTAKRVGRMVEIFEGGKDEDGMWVADFCYAGFKRIMRIPMQWNECIEFELDPRWLYFADEED